MSFNFWSRYRQTWDIRQKSSSESIMDILERNVHVSLLELFITVVLRFVAVESYLCTCDLDIEHFLFGLLLSFLFSIT